LHEVRIRTASPKAETDNYSWMGKLFTERALLRRRDAGQRERKGEADQSDQLCEDVDEEYVAATSSTVEKGADYTTVPLIFLNLLIIVYSIAFG